MSHVDTTPPAALHAQFGNAPLSPDAVRALAAWHRRHRKGDTGWDEHGGSLGREWSISTASALAKQMTEGPYESALDPAQVHVPTAEGDDERDMVAAKATAYEAAPFVDEPWDADAAVSRLRKWAGANTPEDLQDASVRAKYAQGFALVDGDGTKFGDYRLPHHDVRDGKLVTVPAGVSAAMAALNGARGGMKGLSESERKQALAHLEKHRDAWEAEKTKRESSAGRDALLRLPFLRVTQMRLFDPSKDVRSSADYVPISVSTIQVACVGHYRGHPQGEFEFTPEVFDQIVRNFDATKNKRVPVDHEHGSEAPEAVFTTGAPAVGWIVAVENRGAEGLWGTVEWVDAVVVDRVRSGKTMFFSPAVWFDAIHPETGEDVGAMLVSGATTNRPFLDGLQPLAASARPPHTDRAVIALTAADEPITTQRVAASGATETSARLRDGSINNTTETTMDKSPEHKALEGEHDKLMAAHKELAQKHAELTATYTKFKGGVAKHMALDPEAEESEILDALEKKLGELERVQKEEAMRAEQEADADTAMAARALGVTDDAVKAALRTMRKDHRGEFRAAFGAIIEAAQKRDLAPAAPKPAKAQPPAAQLEAAGDAAWARIMSGRVAPQGAGPAPYTSSQLDVEDGDDELAGVGEEHLRIMRENPDMSTLVALSQAERNVRARRNGARQ